MRNLFKKRRHGLQGDTQPFLKSEKGHYALLLGASAIGWLLYTRIAKAKDTPQ